MSLLEEIQADALEESVSLAAALRRCKVLAHRIQYQPLTDWAELELNGYQTTNELPEYRIVQVDLKASGMNSAWRVTGQSVPVYALPESLRKMASTGYFLQGVGVLEASKGNPNIHFDAPPTVRRWLETDGGGNLRITAVYQDIPPGAIAGILSAIRNKIVDFTLVIEDEFPSLRDSQLVTDSGVKDAVAHAFQVTISGGSPVFNLGGQVGIDSSTNFHIETGNLQSLDQFLAKQNISDEHREELKAILREAQSGEDSGAAREKLGRWIGDRANDASEGVGDALKEGTKKATAMMLTEAIKEWVPVALSSAIALHHALPFI